MDVCVKLICPLDTPAWVKRDGGDREDIGVRVRVRHNAQRLTIQGPSGDSKKATKPSQSLFTTTTPKTLHSPSRTQGKARIVGIMPFLRPQCIITIQHALHHYARRPHSSRIRTRGFSQHDRHFKLYRQPSAGPSVYR